MVEGIWRCLVAFVVLVKFSILLIVSLLVCLFRIVFNL